jgi:hypothetical protein
MLVSTLTNFILSAMMTWSPPSNHLWVHEGEDFTTARYEAIAHDLAVVAMTSEPLNVFKDEPNDVAIAHTAIVLAAIASFESGGFRSDVDRYGRDPLAKRGDNGQAHCLLQIHLLRSTDHINDRNECFRLGLDRVRESMSICKSLPVQFRLAEYASGSCSRGRKEAAHRWERMESFWSSAPYFSEEPFLVSQDTNSTDLLIRE